MKFLLHGRAGKYMLHEELLAPTVEVAAKQARRRVEACLGKSNGHRYLSVALELSLPSVWELTNHSEHTMSRNGLLDLIAEDRSAA